MDLKPCIHGIVVLIIGLCSGAIVMRRPWILLCILGTICMAADFPKFEESTLLKHIKVLSSDKFKGRFPGTVGENRTVAYIEAQFKSIGLQPGNTDGTYFQKVPMIGTTPDPSMILTLRNGEKTLRLKYLDDFVAWTRQNVLKSLLKDSQLLFVGYGIQAPEFNWDDYKEVDVRDKTLVMLVNDPPVPDPANPSKLDPNVFGGDAMTYYGRWTYKYDIAGDKGAAAVLLIHETAAAAYPWSVVKGFGGERFTLPAADNDMSRPKVEAWISLEKAKELFQLAGQDFEALKKQAATRAFRPVPLQTTAAVEFRNRIRTIQSRNVLAKIDGKNPAMKNDYIIYTAHWDHLGIGQPVHGDRIYHGAKDNATGVAGLIELARAFKKQATPPERSILFMSVTGEEQGLIGSEYYAKNPIYPLAKTAALINMDGLNTNGRTRDLTIIGLGKSGLDDYAQSIASRQGRVLAPDPEPEKGSYYRSDHFSFSKQGVPSLNADEGIDYIGKPAGFGQKIRDEYTTNDYHKPSDVVKPDWDLSGMIEDLQLLWTVGWEVANSDRYPQWKPGAEFRRK
jgi:Zn-dependent M28 family amino/carboxypeptidase